MSVVSDEIRILHVDDEPEFLDMAATFLEREDERFEVITATDAADGVNRLEASEFDCVVSDYEMPGTTGIEFLETVREADPRLPFIVFTGKGSEEVASDAISSGATDYLQKEPGTEQFELLANRIVNAVSRYRAERAERRLMELAENTDRIRYVFDRDLEELLFVNYAHEEIWGRSIDRLREDPTDLFNGVHPDDRERLGDHLERVSAGESVEVDFRVNPAEDYGVWVKARCEPIRDDAGEVVRVTVSATDVTDEKRRERELLEYERRFEAMFNDPNILVGLLETDGTVLDVNETAKGYVDAGLDDVLGEAFWETPWWSRDQRSDVRRKIERASAGEYVEYEADHVDPDGETVSVAGVIRPVTGDDGDVRSLIVSARDVTDSRRRERELERQNQRLEEFAEVLTHDLRNPLSIATAYLEIIEESPEEGAIRRCANALTRIDSLIEEVQTSILQDRSEPEELPVDLETVARNAWSTADTGGATLEIDGEMRLRADPDQLRRLLENLFQNSAEHGGPDDGAAGRVVERGRPDDAAAADLTVRVVALEDGFAVDDDGVGLPPDVADDVFERGFTTSRQGTGFGLSIVRNIAENHDWSVTVGESEAGGARFRFSQVLRSTESVIEMEAGGEDVWNGVDQGYFYYDEVSGDFDVRVNVPLVENTHAWAKGGIMIRSSTDRDAKHAMIRRRPNGAATLQWRPHDGVEARSLTSDLGRHQQERDVGEPQHDWLRLVRDGREIRAYTSDTGADDDWLLLAELGESEIQFQPSALVGIGGTSHNRAETATIRFKHLEGVDPVTGVDIGDPIRSGSVRTIRPTVVEVDDPADVTSSSATLRGVVESVDPPGELDVRFEYREVTADEWRVADARPTRERDAVQAEIRGLAPRRYYEYKVVADYTDATIRSSATGLVATPSESSGATADGPRSSAHFDPEDGFAALAPWLDDDTPVVTVTEPERDQLETALSIDGPRVVVFETSGTVDLAERDLTVTNDRCWIAGQTAPSPGITLIRGRLLVAADDCVVQHLRARPGDAGHGDDEDDAFVTQGIRTADGTENVVVDHCTATWGVEENQSIGHDTAGTTFSNCLIAEGLRDATHDDGPRAYGTLVGDDAEAVALLGNLWAHDYAWTPRLNDGAVAASVNNLRYHYDGGVEVSASARATVDGDVFVRAVGERPDVNGSGAVCATDNDHAREDEHLQVDPEISRLVDRPCWPEGLEPLAVDELFEHALEHAGARPADRTHHDERVVAQVRDGNGAFVDSQADVGGYPRLEENREELAIPERNLRAWLRERARDVEP